MVGGRVVGRAEQDVFLLGLSIEDVEYPVQSSLIALGLHVRTDVVTIDVRGLGHIANGLCGVFLEMLVGTWVDEVDLQVGRVSLASAAVGHVPAVDVIVAEILDVRERGSEGG